MKNKYEIRGEVTAICLDSPKYGQMEALISTNKLERVKEFVNSWYPKWSTRSKTFYVYGNRPTNNGVRGTEYLHRYITQCPSDMAVDHINHDGSINTDDNLRIVTKGENMQNRRGAAASNKRSGIRGVGLHKESGKWTASVIVNRKSISLGYYSDKHEAERAVKEARAKYMPYSQEAMSAEYDKSKISIEKFRKKKKIDSGIQGITWDKKSNKWHVRYRKNYKTTNLGFFKTIEEAAEVLNKHKGALA